MILPMYSVDECVDTLALCAFKSSRSCVSSLYRFLATQSGNHVPEIESCLNACLWTESFGILREERGEPTNEKCIKRIGMKRSKDQVAAH